MIRYTEEQKEFLINNNYMRTAQELTNLYNKTFSEKIKLSQVLYFRKKYHLKCGVDCTFKKGITPHNKNKKWDEYMPKKSQNNSQKTQFKKGNIPNNYRPIGSERINKGGYIEIKIADPNKWCLKHRYIYEQQYGPLQKGYRVIFLDNNKRNFNISNLKAISMEEELIMNNLKLRYSEKELTESAHIIAQIETKRRELKNGRL